MTTIRTRLGVLAWLLLCLPSAAFAQWGYVGYSQTTIDNTVGGVPLDAAQLNPAGQLRPTQVFCSVETGAIRWTVDGTAPTTTVGKLEAAGTDMTAISGSTLLANFRAIRTTGTSATLRCSYFAGGSLPFRPWGSTSSSSGGGGGSSFDGVLLDAAGGDPLTDTATNALNVKIVSGGGTGGTSLAEDLASANADLGTPAFAVRKASPANTSGTDGDYEALQMSAGRLWVDPSGVTLTVGSHAVTNAGTFAVQVSSAPSTAVTNAGTFAVQAAGTKTNNNAAPGATNVGALTALANASAPSWTEGNLVSLSTDLSGALRVSGSSGTTQYAEDAAHASGNSVVAIGAVRSDTTPSSTAGTAGDYAIPNLDANGRLYVNATLYTAAGAAATLASDVVEDAAETAGGSGPMVMTVRRDTAASSAGTDGDNATLNTDASGRLWVNCGTGCSGGTQYAEDAAHASGNTGTLALVVRNDAATALAADGDNIPLMVNSVGALFTAGTLANDGVAAATNRVATLPGLVETSAPTRTNGRNAGFSFLAGGGARVVITNDAGASQTLASDATHDSAAGSSGPQQMAYAAADGALATAVTAGDAVRVAADLQGIQYVRFLDPCTALPTTTLAVSVAADTALITATSGKRTYLCGGLLSPQADEVINVWEGTGTACGTSSAALIGSTTEANGVSMAAKGGFEISRPLRGLSTNVDVCIRLSGTSRTAGWLSYVQAP